MEALIASALLPLPDPILSAWRETEKKYQSKVSAVQEELKQQEKKTLDKLKTVQRMVNQGSFKPALATFKYAQKMYQALPEKSQKGLSKLYAELGEKSTELQELQAFIAGPRKLALLDAVNALASQQNAESMADRAQSVKLFRAQWNETWKIGNR